MGCFLVQSLRKRRDESGLRGPTSLLAVKCEGPAFGRASSVSISFNSSEWSETKMPDCADLFFGLQVIYFELFMDYSGDDFWVRGT
jgi:hypothetical protein